MKKLFEILYFFIVSVPLAVSVYVLVSIIFFIKARYERAGL
jgi:hypothetical protein